MKPEHRLASIVFSDQGKVSQQIERLPRTQKEREYAIGKKFLNSLARFRQIELSNLVTVEGHADLVAITRDGTSVEIQVVRAVDEMMRKIDDRG